MTRSFCLLLCAGIIAVAGCSRTANTPEDVETANRKLQEGDALVQKWADKLQPEGKGKFVQHEGLTEQDPWGNFIRVTYDHGIITETLEIRSAGPDKKFGTDDDLLRKREHKTAGALFGESRTTGTESGSTSDGWGWPFLLCIWFGLGLFALFIAESRRHRYNRKAGPQPPPADDDGSLRRTNRRRRGVIGAGFIVAFGGLALFTTLFSAFFDALFGCDPCDCSANGARRRNGGMLDVCGACADCAPDCDCEMPDCGSCDCDMPECGGCDAPDCGGCDCGGCDAPDCGGCDCDCGGCDC